MSHHWNVYRLDEMNRGIEMLEAGRSLRHVAYALWVSKTRNVLQGHAGGREHSTTQAQDRFIVIQARRQQFSNATTLRNDFQNATGVRVSTQTETGCMMLGWGHGGQQFAVLSHNAIFKSVCNERRLMDS
jgi:hypothetical protein